ncbi:MAG TPA: AAA family ATPase [Kofleriaceae bacterium]|nr:AAA family ATPase [Kofleriaceae bacterium]
MKPRGLGNSERRHLAVVLLERAADGSDAVTLDAPALRRALGPGGGGFEQLEGGVTAVVIEPNQQVASDQAARAARCALAIAAIVPGRALAIAMGPVDAGSQLPKAAVIERAARMLAQAPRAPGDAPECAPEIAPEIAIDEMTAGLLDARFDVVERAAGLALRGERVLMQGTRTLLGRPTSFVGRDWELGILTALVDDCLEERSARAALVTAAAGMGKSRLATEVIGRVQEHHPEVAIWIGRGDSLRAGSTLDLLAQALRGGLGIGGGEPLAERHARIRGRVGEHVPAADRKRVTEFLAELVGAPLPGDDEGGAALRAARQDASLMSEQMRRAWLDFLAAEAAARPVLLVLEDLHWGDFGTVQFVDAALRERRAHPWMVLALARPELFDVFPELWAGRQNVQQIRLQGLGRKASERLVRQVLGDGVAPDAMERLVAQADGNAFYLEELIRAAAEGKDQALPETVLAMVETRLARLPPEARQVLRAASVFGEVCWESGVAALLLGAMPAPTVGEWLDKLIAQEVLTVRPSRFAGDRELAFRHALLREGAYAPLSEDGRRLAHRLAGEWLEQRGEADPMVLAGHFARGGEGARAASYYLRAGEQAFHVFDMEGTAARADLGLACAPPEELRLRLLGLRCLVSGSGPLLGVAFATAEELLRVAPRGSVPWAQAMRAYINGTLKAGRIGDLLAAIGVLREVDPAPEAVGLMAFSLTVSTYALDLVGRVAEGSSLEDRFSAIIRASGEREPIARLWWNTVLGMRAAYAHEDPWRALQHGEANQQIFEQIGGQIFCVISLLYRGLNLWYLGDPARARPLLEEAAAGDEAMGLASSLRRFSLSWLLADAGELDLARALATRLAEFGHAQGDVLHESRGRWVLAEVLRRAGDLEGAEREALAARAQAVPLERPGVLGTLARLRLAQGRAEEALAATSDAIAQCAAAGGCGMFRGAFVRLAHAEALHATGATDGARTAIADARARLSAIATKIPDPASQQMFQEGVPEHAQTFALARAWLGD